MLKTCGPEICHPLLLPMMIFNHEASFDSEVKQRDARGWLRRLEYAISMRPDVDWDDGYVTDGAVDLDAVNRDLNECYAQTLWMSPIAYLRIADSLKEAMELFYNNLPSERKNSRTGKIQATMLSKLKVCKRKLEGMETYSSTTLARLESQKSSVRVRTAHLPTKALTSHVSYTTSLLKKKVS